jgi:hypothetical protein
VIYGIINMTNTLASGGVSQGLGQTEQITIVYSAMVSGVGSVPGTFNLVPIGDSAKDYDLRNLLSPSILNDFTSGPNDDSIFVAMSNTTGTSDPGGINPLNLNANIGGAADANSIITNLTNGNGWTGDLIGGLTRADDFFEFTGSFALGGSDRAAFTVQEDTFGGIYLPVDVLDFSATPHLSHVTLDVGTVNPAAAAEQGKGWSFRDQGSFYINALAAPEPMSVIMWAGLSALAGVAAWRHRSMSK